MIVDNIKCPFACLFEINCPYYNVFGECTEVQTNVQNDDAWCTTMINLGLDAEEERS